MQFRYPARLQADPSGEILVSFRDFPECLTSGTDHAVALIEARDALEEAVAGRIDDDEPIRGYHRHRMWNARARDFARSPIPAISPREAISQLF